MSSIRKALPPTRNKLLRLITEAKSLNMVVDPNDKNGIKDALERFNTMKMDIRQSLRTINASVSQWEDLIADLADPEKTTEQNLLNQWLADSSDQSGLDSLIADALQSLGELQYNIEEMDAVLHPKIPAATAPSQLNVNGATQGSTTQDTTSTTPKTEIMEQVNAKSAEPPTNMQELPLTAASNTPIAPWSVKLHDLKPVYFDGNIFNWLPFEDYFLTHIHASPMPDVTKLAYLLDSLQGPAKKAVQGTSCSASNYHVIWKKLKTRFGDVNVISSALQHLLSEIVPCSDNAKTYQVRQVFDLMENYLNQLEILGHDVSHPQFGLNMENAMPLAIREELVKKRIFNRNWSTADTRRYINEQLTLKEALQNLRSPPRQQHEHHKASVFAVTDNKKKRLPCCAFCDGDHWSEDCSKYKNFKERTDRLKERNRCFRCLAEGHSSKDCKRKKSCFHCKLNHNSALCQKKLNKSLPQTSFKSKVHAVTTTVSENSGNSKTTKHTANDIIQQVAEHEQSMSSKHGNWDDDPASDSTWLTDDPVADEGNEQPPLTHDSTTLFANKNVEKEVVLPVIKVGIKGRQRTKCQKGGVLLDIGSQDSFITESMAQKLHIKPTGKEYLNISGFGEKDTTPVIANVYMVQVQLKNKSWKEIECFGVEKITDSLSTVIQAPKESALKTPTTAPVNIELLIGANYFFEFVQSIPDTPHSSGFWELKTSLGAVLCGKGNVSKVNVARITKASDEVEELIKFDFSLASVGINDDPHLDEDERAERIVTESIKKVGDRYQAELPKKVDKPELPTNFALSRGRLQSVLTLLHKKNPAALEEYLRILKEQLESGIIEEIEDPKVTDGRQIYYIPHMMVNPNKPRIVFDASAKTKKSDNSLNDVLLKGPLLLGDLAGMILRFRIPEIAVSCDLEKAFHQIQLMLEDKDLTRFLFVKDINKPAEGDNLRYFRFSRLPFGLISSPFILNAVIRYILSTYDSATAKEIMNNIYVDNVLITASSSKEAEVKCKEAVQIFKEAGMNLREFTSNNEDINKMLGDKLQTKFLGLAWDHDADTISVNTVTPEVDKPTRRDVAALPASTFDPLGIASPAFVEAKQFLQEITTSKKYNWKDALDEKDKATFLSIVQKLKGKSLRIKRKVTIDEPDKIQIHAFADASKTAYAAAVYLVTNKGKKYESHLVFAKSKICPKDKGLVTIPKLELVAAAMAAKIGEYVKKQLRLANCEMYLWTDSSCVMGWLQNDEPTKFPVFIKNRVLLVQSTGFKPRHVRTDKNPADFGSRGKLMEELADSALWLNGPHFLQQGEEHWPNEFQQSTEINGTSASASTVSERKTAVNLAISSTQNSFIDATRSSSWKKLVRIYAWVLRSAKKFKKNDKIPQVSKVLQPEELQLATEMLIRKVQEAYPPDKVTIQRLDLIKDPKDIWRCKGRLSRAEMNENAKHPVYLPREAKETQLLIQQIHSDHFHVGLNQTINELRKDFWVPKAKATTAKIINNCHSCKRWTSKPFKAPHMADLPIERVTRSRPFAHVGVDYFGPIECKPNDQKIWVALFTCFATRAIHLEVVPDASAAACLNAVRRFIARYGLPLSILSDNGSQLKATAKAINTTWTSQSSMSPTDALWLQDYCSSRGIKWKHIVELAPWQGGVWERAVGLIKKPLKVAIGSKKLTIDELSTLLAEICAVVNCRPLLQVDGESDEGLVIRPVDLLAPFSQPGTPTWMPEDVDDPDYLEKEAQVPQKLIELWKQSNKMLDKFWRKWLDQYLPSLREKHRKEHQGPKSTTKRNPEVGEIVIIMDNQAPRATWKLGRIKELEVSADKSIRAATVEAANGRTLRRAINHLLPLELTKPHDPKNFEYQNTNPKRDGTITEERKHQLLNGTPEGYVLNDDEENHFYKSFQATPALKQPQPSKAKEQDNDDKKVPSEKVDSNKKVKTKSTEQANKDEEVAPKKQKTQYNLRPRKTAMTTLLITLSCLFTAVAAECPSWATKCASTPISAADMEKSSTFAQETYAALLNHLPDICSIRNHQICSKTPTKKTVHKIQLYDLSEHYVDELVIVENPLPSLHLDGVDIPIRAWGTINVEVFDYPPKVTTCSSCTATCVKGGILLNLDSAVNVAEVCAIDHCERIMVPKLQETINLPKDVVIRPYPVTIRSWIQGLEVQNQKLECPANVLCEQLECTICWDKLWNNHCIKTWEVVLFSAAGAAALFILCCCMKVFSCCTKIFKCFKKICKWITCAWKRKKEHKQKQRRSYSKITWKKAALATPILLALISPTESCPEVAVLTAKENKCVHHSNGTMMCEFEEITRMTIRPNGQSYCLLLKDHLNKSMGIAQFQIEKVTANCKKETMFFSRHYQGKVKSQQRCPKKGSCVGNACAEVKANDEVHELAEVKHFPGPSSCANGPEWINGGCALPSPSCIFYKLYAQPTNQEILEIFDCQVWVPKIYIKILIKHENQITENVILESGSTYNGNNLSITIVNLDLPPTPALNYMFIKDDSTLAILDNNQLGRIMLKCNSTAQAQEMKNCDYNPQCMCQPAEEEMKCICRQEGAAKEALTSAFLPQARLGFLVTPENGLPIVTFEKATMELEVHVKGLTMTAMVESTSCFLTVLKIQGCHSCKTGSVATFNCKSSYGQPTLELECKSQSILIPCSTESITSNQLMFFNKKIVNENCIARCPASSEPIVLKATLNDPEIANHHDNEAETIQNYNTPNDTYYWLYATISASLFILLLFIKIIF